MKNYTNPPQELSIQREISFNPEREPESPLNLYKKLDRVTMDINLDELDKTIIINPFGQVSPIRRQEAWYGYNPNPSSSSSVNMKPRDLVIKIQKTGRKRAKVSQQERAPKQSISFTFPQPLPDKEIQEIKRRQKNRERLITADTISQDDEEENSIEHILEQEAISDFINLNSVEPLEEAGENSLGEAQAHRIFKDQLQETENKKFYNSNKENLINSKKIENLPDDPLVKRNLADLSKTDSLAEAQKHQICTCKKSKCAKLYCVCFRFGTPCNLKCKCRDCKNTVEDQENAARAREEIFSRNPSSFNSEVYLLKSGARVFLKGCSCRKSRCAKNYCECFQSGSGCSNLCKCTQCKNSKVKLSAQQKDEVSFLLSQISKLE